MFCTDRASMVYRFFVEPSGVAVVYMLLSAAFGIAVWCALGRLSGPRK
jgi:hypothetical protein